MVSYLEKEKEQLILFSAASIEVILQSKNLNVDALGKLASTRDVDLLDAVSMELIQEQSWMDPIVAYLKTGEQLKGKTEARILRLKATRYVLYDDKLYRRGNSMPLLKYNTPLEA